MWPTKKTPPYTLKSRKRVGSYLFGVAGNSYPTGGVGKEIPALNMADDHILQFEANYVREDDNADAQNAIHVHRRQSRIQILVRMSVRTRILIVRRKVQRKRKAGRPRRRM